MDSALSNRYKSFLSRNSTYNIQRILQHELEQEVPKMYLADRGPGTPDTSLKLLALAKQQLHRAYLP